MFYTNLTDKKRTQSLKQSTSLTAVGDSMSTFRIAQKTSFVNGKETLKIKDMLSGVLDMDRNLYLFEEQKEQIKQV